MSAIDNVYAARSKDRPTGMAYINNIFTDFTELHGDRRYGDDKAVVGGLAYLNDIPVTVIAHEKGTDTKSRVARNFGSAHPEGYRKSLRLMKQAEKFFRPVICFVDTSGAYCGIGAEERGQGQSIAENIYEMMALKTPIISILIGEGGSGGALALAVANEVWMLQKAVYSVISPEGCASILYKDAKLAPVAAENLKLRAEDLYKLRVIEKIIPEKDGKDHSETYEFIKRELNAALIRYMGMTGDELYINRYNKFRQIGNQGVI